MDARNDPARAASGSGVDDELSMEAALLAQAQARVGTVLRDKYSIERVLGVGGMAVVYVATHRNRQCFAIKMLHPLLSVNPAVRARFLGEGYRANSVRHRGAVKVLDDDVAEDGSVFLVMELLDGESLDRVAERFDGRLPARAVLAIGHQLMDVLAAAHAANVVHRDIKPANLFLTREGTLKVLDFGIARLLETTGGQVTHTGAVLGTPAFMAPEQARGMLDDIDGQTDIWAAGATLFSLLTGSLVHESENAQMLLVHAATQPAPSLETLAPDAPPGLIAVVDRALAFDKAARWLNAAQMRDAIRDTYVVETGEDLSPAPLLSLMGTAPLVATTTIPVPRSVPKASSSRPFAIEAGGDSREERRTPTPPSPQVPPRSSPVPRGRIRLLVALVVGVLATGAWFTFGRVLFSSRESPTKGNANSSSTLEKISGAGGDAAASSVLKQASGAGGSPSVVLDGSARDPGGTSGPGPAKNHFRRRTPPRDAGPHIDPSSNTPSRNPLEMPLE